ncbi:hypothetical protein [Sediminicola sp. 1XM1-17]|uniref:hypothetical protein n=1 Tax=Sediminicola sp. 1XM1-17 TaxID=3127702 RepID=UPI003076FDD7
MNFEHLTTSSWLLLAMFGIICTIFGYVWGKTAPKDPSLSRELSTLRERTKNLQLELETCNKQLTSMSEAEVASKPVKIPPPQNVRVSFNAELAKESFGKKIKLDDLKVIEGIGPKIEKLFHDHEIRSWEDLSKVSVHKCQEVLDSGGDRYRIHNPGSWPMQAKMASEGKWKALARWQEEHKAGKL